MSLGRMVLSKLSPIILKDRKQFASVADRWSTSTFSSELPVKDEYSGEVGKSTDESSLS